MPKVEKKGTPHIYENETSAVVEYLYTDDRQTIIVTIPNEGEEAAIQFSVGTRGTAGRKKFYSFTVAKDELPDLKGARSPEWGPVFRLCNENGSTAEVETLKVTTGFAKELKTFLLIFGPLAVLAIIGADSIRKKAEKKRAQKILEKDPGLQKKQPRDLE
ncbi:MAG: hypothetical protein E7223_01235 [Clostridiales bacterium]|nr:hypothetical protein [Clostridiales bacterium]